MGKLRLQGEANISHMLVNLECNSLDLTYKWISPNNLLLLRFLWYDKYIVVTTEIIYISNSYSHLLVHEIETHWIPAGTELDTVSPITLTSQSLYYSKKIFSFN